MKLLELCKEGKADISQFSNLLQKRVDSDVHDDLAIATVCLYSICKLAQSYLSDLLLTSLFPILTLLNRFRIHSGMQVMAEQML